MNDNDNMTELDINQLEEVSGGIIPNVPMKPGSNISGPAMPKLQPPVAGTNSKSNVVLNNMLNGVIKAETQQSSNRLKYVLNATRRLSASTGKRTSACVRTAATAKTGASKDPSRFIAAVTYLLILLSEGCDFFVAICQNDFLYLTGC